MTVRTTIGGYIESLASIPNLDVRWGPYSSREAAFNALGPNGMDKLDIGLTVGILEGGSITEYWFKDGISSYTDLVRKYEPSNDYVDLINKPQINGYTLLGDVSGDTLGLSNKIEGVIVNNTTIAPDNHKDIKINFSTDGNGSLVISDKDNNEISSIPISIGTGDLNVIENVKVSGSDLSVALKTVGINFSTNGNGNLVISDAINNQTLQTLQIVSGGGGGGSGNIDYISVNNRTLTIDPNTKTAGVTFNMDSLGNLIVRDKYNADNNTNIIVSLPTSNINNIKVNERNLNISYSGGNRSASVKFTSSGDGKLGIESNGVRLDEITVYRPEITPYLISTTYSEIKSLRDNAELIPGVYYRITDYECVTIQEYTRSAGHKFDIIVLALDRYTLSEKAWATYHDGDPYFNDLEYNWIDPSHQQEFEFFGYLCNDELLYHEEPNDGYNTIITEYGYKRNKQGQLVPALFNPSPDDNYDYNRWYIFNGKLTIDGVIYDSWYEKYNNDQYNIEFEGILHLTEELVELTNESNSSNLGAWQLWYSLDPDPRRFGWVFEGEREEYELDIQSVGSVGGLDEPYLLVSQGKIVDYDPSLGRLWFANSDWKYSSSFYFQRDNQTVIIDGVEYYKWIKQGQQSGNIYLFTTDREPTIKTVICKGVIYRMIDEYGNDCPYDFKNIQFMYPTREDKVYPINMGSDMIYFNYTFSYLDGQSYESTDISAIRNRAYNNVIKPLYTIDHDDSPSNVGIYNDGICKQILNHIVLCSFDNSSIIVNNKIDTDCYYIVLSGSNNIMRIIIESDCKYINLLLANTFSSLPFLEEYYRTYCTICRGTYNISKMITGDFDYDKTYYIEQTGRKEIIYV